MECIFEAISHRRRARFGKKRLILGRSTSVHLPRLHRFFLESDAALDCDSFSDSFLRKRNIEYLISLPAEASAQAGNIEKYRISSQKIFNYFFFPIRYFSKLGIRDSILRKL
jgi:hypothetical protein